MYSPIAFSAINTSSLGQSSVFLLKTSVKPMVLKWAMVKTIISYIKPTFVY